MSVVQEIGRLVKVDTPMIDAVLALIKLREAVNQGTAQPRPLTETQKAA